LSKEQQKREPLLYIHQPGFHFPEGKMQKSFSAKQAERKIIVEEDKTIKEQKNQWENRSAIEPQQVENTLTSEEIQQTIEDYEQKNKIQESGHGEFGLRRLKPFREMDLIERLDYLEHFPRQLPPISCIFQTEKKAIRGILLEKSEHVVVIRLFDKTEVEVAIKDLIEVRMVGLS
jgi:hypothetical protein